MTASIDAQPPDGYELLRGVTTFHHAQVLRRGDVVLREPGPHTPALHALLRHLQDVGFAGAPRVVGSGYDDAGRETLSYIEGEFTQPGPWTLDGAAAVGRLLSDLHQATRLFRPPDNAAWKAWFLRLVGDGGRIIGHGDFAPWNIVARDGRPVAVIDWEFAGPIDPLAELAYACWLNAKLYSDDVAEVEGLPDLGARARQLRAIIDAYGAPKRERAGFVDRIVEVAVHYTAYQADDVGVTRDTIDTSVIWGLAWPARSAAWMLRNRSVLQNALA